ncbi:MAG TPA: TetR/AcrR family transcriptional regulator, partial [Chitinophagaceae bacterium]|nr:TetR/AcrR family transcriptional regulator [Chitinophagaceae bacterium]
REIKKGTIRRVHPLHLLMHLLSMTIFPFIARPMITRNLHLSDPQFRKAMEERKREIPEFIIESIRK